MTTYEETKLCPKCGEPGELTSQTPALSRALRPGTTAHIFYCRNEQCKWFDTWWIVQVNPDGTIPPPNYGQGQAKQFPTLITPEEEQRVVDNIAKQIDLETREGGGEVRGR
jgi:hypothetical protein